VSLPLSREDRPVDHSPSRDAAPGRVSHVFIVGVSRSGTTLMRRVLERSSEIAISGENHYLGHLIAREGVRHRLRRFGDLSSDENVRRLVAHIYSDRFMESSLLRRQSRHWLYLRRNVPPEELERRILCSDRSERAIFDAILDSYAERKGKRIRGEKTPAHVRYVDTLLRWYPDGRVIHMLRDPRAVYVSEVNRRRKEHDSFPYRLVAQHDLLLKPFVAIETLAAWIDSVRRMDRHRKRFGERCIIVRFEDLVTEPERELKRLCGLLGVPFEAEMLDQRVVSQGFRVGDSGFDPRAADRWRGLIDGWVDRSYRALLGRSLARLGYRP
jgi:hypothetical protein